MKRVKDLKKKNSLLKRELEKREVKENLRRKKEPEMEKSYTFIVGDAKPVDTAKKEPEIEERLHRKQEETQKELSPGRRDGDATGTTLEKQTVENMERRRKASYQDHEKAYRIPERRTSCNDEQGGKAHGRRRGSNRDSESGQKASDKRKGPYDEDESREKTAQRILKRRKGRTKLMQIPLLSIGLDTTLGACDRGRNYPKRGGMW